MSRIESLLRLKGLTHQEVFRGPMAWDKMKHLY